MRAGLARVRISTSGRPGAARSVGSGTSRRRAARRKRTPAAARGGRPASTRLTPCGPARGQRCGQRARATAQMQQAARQLPTAAAPRARARRSPLGGLPARQASAASAPRPAAPHPRSTPLLADLPHRLASPSSARVSLARPRSVSRSPRRLAPRSVSSSSARSAQGTHRSTCAQRPHTELAARPRSESAALSAPQASIAFACARSSLGALTRTASAGGVPDVLASRARRVQP